MREREAPARGIEDWLARARAWAESELERALPRATGEVAALENAMRYAVFGGGKRLRPALVKLLCEHCGGSERDAALPAVAIELVHTYSLVHDDLPCMDDDDLRRGRPTCHKVFGEAVAVLVGDALLTEAFALLARAGERAPALIAALARGAGAQGMVGGQALDLALEQGAVTRDRVEAIHLRKTAALLAAATELGAIAAGAPDATRTLARDFGLALGRCFQATDDILDVTGDSATLGKTPGKDARKNKPTLVAALGIEGARVEAARLAAEVERAAQRLGAAPGDVAFDLGRHLLARTA